MDDLLFEDAVTAEMEEEIPVPEKPKKSIKAEIIDWAKTLLFYCVIPLLVFQTFCFMASVPTGSMETTIPVGAQVITTRVFNKDNINRGDIVVLNFPFRKIVISLWAITEAVLLMQEFGKTPISIKVKLKGKQDLLFSLSAVSEYLNNFGGKKCRTNFS